jgi:hypothetical protein
MNHITQIKPWYEFGKTELTNCYRTIITENGPKEQVVGKLYVELLFQKSCLQYAYEYVKLKTYYIYDKDQGIYQELVESEMTLLIALLLHQIDPSMSESDETYLINLTKKRLSRGKNARFGYPEFEKGVYVFTNGTLFLKDMKLIPWTPEVFITSRNKRLLWLSLIPTLILIPTLTLEKREKKEAYGVDTDDCCE